jgi:Flp pilus assembly protein TadG
MVTRIIAATSKRLRKRQEGQAIVEFALIAPIFLLLVFGVVEFGRAWNVYQTLTDAVREGARTAAVANPAVTVDTVAARMNANMYSAGLDTASAIKTLTGFRAGTGTSVRVTIAYPYQLRWLSPFLGWTGAQAQFNMNSDVTFRNE